jgi:hypothetical protein
VLGHGGDFVLVRTGKANSAGDADAPVLLPAAQARPSCAVRRSLMPPDINTGMRRACCTLGDEIRALRKLRRENPSRLTSSSRCAAAMSTIRLHHPIQRPAETAAVAEDLLRSAKGRRFATLLVDPPWQFTNKTGKVAPEHKRLTRYRTMTLPEIMALPVEQLTAPTSHLYLWCANALLPDGLAVMSAWGFTYKTNLVWQKVRKDGGSDGRGVGFYFRNVTELVLFGVRGKNARTLAPGRR